MMKLNFYIGLKQSSIQLEIAIISENRYRRDPDAYRAGQVVSDLRIYYKIEFSSQT